MNCLNQAVSEERVHQVRLLLSMDVDSEMRDKSDHDRTPLIKSCMVKNREPSLKLTKILLKFGVAINASDNLGRSALHYACDTGKSEVAKALMNEDDIELNTQDNEGQTPLMLACSEGHLAMARILMGKLVKFDLEIDVRDRQGYTALLLSIKNEHYDVAHDLVRYANACITLRDNKRFMNAAEWLKSNQEGRRKTVRGPQETEKTKRKRHGAKSPSKSDKNKENKDEQTDDVPTLTLTETQEQVDADQYEGNGQEQQGRARSAAAMSGLLFEPDQYGGFTRPPSSEKRLLAGSVSYSRPPSSGQESTARPLTGASVTSSVGRFSASSKARQMRKMDQLKEETSPTPSATPTASPVISILRREVGTESTVSFATSRGSRRFWKADDLESIIEDSHSRLPSRAGETESVNRSHSRHDYTRATSRTPASNRIKSPFGKIGRNSKNETLDEEKSSEIYAIQKLKQALRDKSRRKITRASTAVFRPASGVPSEQWMTAIIKGTKRGPMGAKSAHSPPKTAEHLPGPPPPRKQSLLSLNADTNSVTSGKDSRKQLITRIKVTGPAMRLLHASSNLSLDTLISDSDVTTSTTYFPSTEKSQKSKSCSQLNTIFRLYTDSCLWKPPSRKPASLSVQVNSDNSDKMTLHSEMSDDVGSIVGDRLEVTTGSTAGSVQLRNRPESKIGARNRLASSSATSRISRGSRNAGSAGGRSIASRHAD